jgi:putative nucleotidyltransferase with HDIG domain
MGLFRQVGSRRAEIRKNRPDLDDTFLGRLRRSENHIPLLIALGFALCTAAVLMMRPNVLEWRVGQYAPHDIVARVDFTWRDPDALNLARIEARQREPRVYKTATPDPFQQIADELLALPERVKDKHPDELTQPYDGLLDGASVVKLREYADPSMAGSWKSSVDTFIEQIRLQRLIILPTADRNADRNRFIRIPGQDAVRIEETYSPDMTEALEARLSRPAQQSFATLLFPRIVGITIARLTPNYQIDPLATAEAQNRASGSVPESAGDSEMRANMTIVNRGEIKASDHTKLRAEHTAYLESLGSMIWWQRLGLASVVFVLTGVTCGYVLRYQPRIVRNNARALGLASLMLSMLLLSQLTGIGSMRSYVFGIAPTVMVAMILAIAYDQRFALGIGVIHAVFAAIALGEGVPFLFIVVTGVATCCYLLEDVRTRSKLIEVGGATAVAMMGATVAAGWVAMDPPAFIVQNAIYAGAAGLAVGFLTLGILPFVERVFRITTSMTLLELADASHPLLRRLAIEAPGTYNHSLQVATLSEEAAEVIGGNSLLCRVAAYYHDIGKINKAEYFVENQLQPSENRHINLSPSVSLLIIIGHVKDGVEMAKEYNLPTSFIPFIQQHHGTTLVEFFYHRARKDAAVLEQEVAEHQYRYPGPKPRSKEVAIVMVADACESACRALDDPNASRIETLVHELSMKRLLDGQFDECDLTMRELELIERSLIKSLIGLYHARIAYPSDKPEQPALTQTQPGVDNPSARTA